MDKKEKSMKTTKADFKAFKRECRKWIKFWGLNNWEVHYIHESINGTARCIMKLSGYTATIVLAKTIRKKYYTRKYILQCAFHEVCELLLGRFNINAQSRFIAGNEIEESSHEVIRILENVIYRKGNK